MGQNDADVISSCQLSKAAEKQWSPRNHIVARVLPVMDPGETVVVASATPNGIQASDGDSRSSPRFCDDGAEPSAEFKCRVWLNSCQRRRKRPLARKVRCKTGRRALSSRYVRRRRPRSDPASTCRCTCVHCSFCDSKLEVLVATDVSDHFESPVSLDLPGGDGRSRLSRDSWLTGFCTPTSKSNRCSTKNVSVPSTCSDGDCFWDVPVDSADECSGVLAESYNLSKGVTGVLNAESNLDLGAASSTRLCRKGGRMNVVGQLVQLPTSVSSRYSEPMSSNGPDGNWVPKGSRSRAHLVLNKARRPRAVARRWNRNFRRLSLQPGAGLSCGDTMACASQTAVDDDSIEEDGGGDSSEVSSEDSDEFLSSLLLADWCKAKVFVPTTVELLDGWVLVNKYVPGGM